MRCVVLAAALAACAHSSTPPPAKTARLNAPGALVEVQPALVAGYVTIVDFWSASCGACKVVGDKVGAAIASEPRVVVRVVDVGDGTTAVAQHYDVSALPRYHVYDRARRLRYILVGPDCLRAPDLARALLAEP